MGEFRDGDAGYPERLRDLRSPPDPVFLDGRWDHPGPIVAVVGTRRASDDGCDVAFELARGLARRGVAVVSGLARGIDAAAHRGALEAGGPSGAVLGTPLDTVYPPEHGPLQQELRRSLGLMSELRPGDPVTRSTFAARNRILAALSHAVIVVQGGLESGALITAREARRLGRPVGAIPWDSRDPLAEAPHGLLREHQASIVCHVEDVMLLLGKPSGPPPVKVTSPLPALSGNERALYGALRQQPRSLDQVASRAGLTAAELGIALVSLELRGLAVRVPGGSAKRTRR